MNDKEYFADRSMITNSMLGWAMAGPKYLYKKLHKPEEEEDEPDYFKFGRAAHMKLFESKRFSSTYFVPYYFGPTNAIQINFCDLLINSEKNDDDALKTAYKMSYSVKKITDETILKKAKILYKEKRNYIDERKKNLDRLLLSKSDYKRISAFENNIKRHTRASQLIYGECGLSIDAESYYEKVIKFESGKGIKFKSKIDKFTIDSNLKKVIVVEFKTHSVKNETTNMTESFKKSFSLFNYDRQFYVYYLAVVYFIKNELKMDPLKFNFEFKTVVAKSNFDNEVRVFSIDKSLLDIGAAKFDEALDAFSHYKTFGYDYPYNVNKLLEEEIKYEK